MCSDKASFMTGAAHVVDGGYYAAWGKTPWRWTAAHVGARKVDLAPLEADGGTYL